MTLRIGASADNGAYVDGIVVLLTGTGALQMNQITGYVGASKVATMGRAWTTNPSSDTTYIILPGSGSPLALASTVWAAVAEGGHTYGDLMRGLASFAMGKVSNFSTGVLAFRNLADTATRFTITRSALGRIASVINDLIT